MGVERESDCLDNHAKRGIRRKLLIEMIRQQSGLVSEELHGGKTTMANVCKRPEREKDVIKRKIKNENQ